MALMLPACSSPLSKVSIDLYVTMAYAIRVLIAYQDPSHLFELTNRYF